MYRRRVMILVAALAMSLSSSGVVTATRVAVPPDDAQVWDAKLRQVALGVSMWDGRDLRDLDAYRTSIGGRTPATWTIWSQWGDPATKAFPTTAAQGAKKRGATPMIWWEPVTPSDHSDGTYARYANINAGDHDAYIREFAREAKRFKSPVILRFAPEANGGFHPWTVEWFDNTAASFVAAWRRVRGIFRDVGASNVRFLWSVAKKGCSGGCNPYAEFYPGDAHVDYMGFSSFNWGDEKDRWVSMLQGFTRVTEHLSQISSKPIIAVESACNPEGGDKAAWISEGYPAVYDALPAIVAIVYLNVDLRGIGHPDWRLESPPEALRAYAAIAAMPRFQGKLPG